MANMRFFRFYTTMDLENNQDRIVISDPQIFHKVKNVLRFKVGDEITLFNGDGFDYKYKIKEFLNANHLHLEKNGNRARALGQGREKKVNLFISLIKKDKLEWILEKGTEIGVSEFHPIISDRSEKKDFSSNRGERKIIEALEQSGQAIKPKLYEIQTLDQILKLNFVGEKLFLSLNSSQSIDEFVLSKNEEINIFVGPEGGWSSEEEQKFIESGFKPVSLGTSILKTETASLVAVSKILI